MKNKSGKLSLEINKDKLSHVSFWVLELNEGFCLCDIHGILLSLQTHKSIFD